MWNGKSSQLRRSCNISKGLGSDKGKQYYVSVSHFVEIGHTQPNTTFRLYNAL